MLKSVSLPSYACMLMERLCLQLVKEKDLNLRDIRFFVVDECDKVLDKAGAVGFSTRLRCCS